MSDDRDLVAPPGGIDITPGGGATDLSKYAKVGTDLQVSPDLKPVDEFHANNSDTFHTSDLSVPSVDKDTWQPVSANLQTSQGPGSGQIDQKTQINNDAQWIRAFSLTVYSQAKTGGGSVPIPAAAPPRQPKPPARIIPFRRRGVVTLLDDPAVSSKGDTIPAYEKQTADQPAMDISKLRCSFSIQKTTLQTPNMLYARVYNLSPATLAKVIEFTRVQVYAGYKYAAYGIIFDGEVIQYRRGKENPVDTYLEIHAADGDTINSTTMFKTYPKGTKERQKLDDLNNIKKKLDPNFKVDQVDDKLYVDASLRDTVVVGHARDIERRMFLASGAQHFVDNGAFIAITEEHYRAGEVVVLSPNTGLVGLPEVTPQGIQVKCLLNPKLKLGGLVQIDSNLLSAVAYTPGTASKTDDKGNVIPGDPTGGKVYNTNMWRQNLDSAYTSPIGQYKILLMTYTGDTRGNPWYCDMTCIAMNSKGEAIVGNNAGSAWNRRASEQAIKGTQATGNPNRR
jgi:hypothetical protein